MGQLYAGTSEGAKSGLHGPVNVPRVPGNCAGLGFSTMLCGHQAFLRRVFDAENFARPTFTNRPGSRSNEDTLLP